MTETRITDPVTGGQKGRKPERFDLFPFDALEEVARVYGMGASKYADDNWLKGYAWRLSLGALLRHVSRFAIGEDRDPESGCLHLAHACWHTLTLLTFCMRGLGTDDRAKVEAENPDVPVPFSLKPRLVELGHILRRKKDDGERVAAGEAHVRWPAWETWCHEDGTPILRPES